MESITEFNSKNYKLIKNFVCGRYICILIQDNTGRLILICEKDDGTQRFVDYFKNMEALLVYVIKNELLSRGEDIG